MPKATATFDANDSPLQAAFRRADKGLLGLEKKFAAVARVAASMLALPAAVGLGLAAGVGKALDVGGELNDLSARTGTAAGDLQKLQQEFKNSGKAGEDVGPVLNKMQKALATGSGAETLSKLGLKLEDLKKKTSVEQFHAIGDAINRVSDPAEKSAAAMDLFGKSGGELLSLFASGGFGDAAAQVGGQAELLSKDAALFDDVSDKLALAGLKVQGFFVGVADQVAPVLKPLLDEFATMDFSQLGQQVGSVISMFVQAFSDGTLGEILFESLKISLANFGNVLIGMFAASANLFWNVIKVPFESGVAIFEVLTTADFWKGMGSALMGIAQGFVAFLLDGVAMLLDKLAGIPLIGDKIGGSAQVVRDTASSIRGAGQENRSNASELLAPVVARAGERVLSMVGNIGTALAEGFNAGSRVIDVSAMEERLGGLLDGVMSNAQSVSEKALRDAGVARPGNPISDISMSAAKASVSSLQRIGGVSGGGGGDPLLSETKTTNSLLRQIHSALQAGPQRVASVRGSVFSTP